MYGDLGFALAAGLVAAFNPCGFALLPSYLTLLIAGSPGLASTWRALRLSAAMTAGFVTVFGAYGLIATAFAVTLQPYLPWATVVIGFALLGVGGWLLTGRELLIRLPRLRIAGPSGSVFSLFGYGASYAIASLSCTIAPFLAVTGTAFDSGELARGLAVFVAYGVGMGLVVGLLSMAVALARSAAITRARSVLPHVSRISGGLLVLAGAYVGYYGWYELRVNAGAAADDPVVGLATHMQGAVTQWLDQIGIGWVALAFAVVAATAAAGGARARRRANQRRRLGRDPTPNSAIH